jgi:hypothetical protein
MKHCGFAQLPFSFSGFFSQYMTAVRLFALKPAGTGTLKTLRGAAVGFDFRHLFCSNKK